MFKLVLEKAEEPDINCQHLLDHGKSKRVPKKYLFLVAQTVKCLSIMQETWVPSLSQEDPLEKEMAIHSSTVAWKIPWEEEPGRLHSIGSQRVGHDWVTSLSFPFTTDYAKATDCVDHNKLWKILKEMGIPDHLTCLLRNLYTGQETTVRTGCGTTDWFQIGKGVRQGCVLSLCLFNLYAEYIMRNAGLENTSWN